MMMTMITTMTICTPATTLPGYIGVPGESRIRVHMIGWGVGVRGDMIRECVRGNMVMKWGDE